MKEFWVNFSGYCKVKAENESEAEVKFWEWYNQIQDCADTSDDVVDIDGIEEAFDWSGAEG